MFIMRLSSTQTSAGMAVVLVAAVLVQPWIAAGATSGCPIPIRTQHVRVGLRGVSSTTVTSEGECVMVPGNARVTFEFNACKFYPCSWAPNYQYYLSSVSWSYYTTVAYSGFDWQVSCVYHPHPIECRQIAECLSLVRVGPLGVGHAHLSLTVDLRSLNISSLLTTTTSHARPHQIPAASGCIDFLLTPYAWSVDFTPVRICQRFPQAAQGHRAGQLVEGQGEGVRGQFTQEMSEADALGVASGVRTIGSNSWVERAAAASAVLARPGMFLISPALDTPANMSCILPVMSQFHRNRVQDGRQFIPCLWQLPLCQFSIPLKCL
ncbi:uncharacterized protein LOC133493078 [Syngnathoides biaculeatus]|uniref:uncharacterized protein LOC133493078 n=1 Tax=Syngnathoides biaculeatus TaxID=300417 RepID=UPI002ADD35D9|nr:uncharacterized protein LOC133493078 [Syngnathoides biaculeatus]XP_061662029.1 uncharacterized protein LOC133493078 [Syngnathoides biaculeatus]